MLFNRKKTFFFKNYSSSYFNFSKFKIFDIFLPKNLINRLEKTFLSNDIIWYAFYSKFFSFGVFFRKDPIFYMKKNPNFIGLLSFGVKKFQVQNRSAIAFEVGHYQFANQRKRKRWIWAFWKDDLKKNFGSWILRHNFKWFLCCLTTLTTD